MKTALIEIRDLLAFQLKQAKRHNLDEIKITVPRSKLILNQIKDALNEKI